MELFGRKKIAKKVFDSKTLVTVSHASDKNYIIKISKYQ